ncbi:hypothetical protein T484DRAFT_1788499 [Baffinella frigidus]|nr:hypothetical protein T484DRAFT_1788499 [Cryptophyta sp. CCMP2293]
MSRAGLLVLLTLAGLASVAGFAGGEVCLAHADCSATSFCKVGECSTIEGAAMLCGKCAGCSQCRCASQAVDNACPAHCAAASPAIAESLQGRYVAMGVQALSRRYGDPGQAANVLDEVQAGQCFQIWEFEGSVFSQQAMRKVPPLFPLRGNETMVEGDASCADGQSGMAGGAFSVVRQGDVASLVLTYTWSSGSAR